MDRIGLHVREILIYTVIQWRHLPQTPPFLLAAIVDQ